VAVGRGLTVGWSRLKQSSFARGLAVLTSASLLQNLIVFGTAPIVSRLFLPAEFGVAGLIQGMGAVPIVLVTGQYYSAIGIARSRAEAINLVVLSLLLVAAGTAAVLPLALWLQAHPGLLPAGLAGAVPYLWTIPAFMVATNLVFMSRLWEVRHANYRSQVTNRLLESGGMAAAQIVLGLLGGGALGLIVGRWLGAAAAAVHGGRLFVGQVGRAGRRAVRRRRLRAAARRHWRFPVYQLPAAVLNGLTPQLTPLLLGLLFTLKAVGFYWFASRLLERPAIVIGDNVARVFFQHAADRRRAGEPVFGLFWRSTAGLAALGVVPFGLVILFGPVLFAWVFGAVWETAGHYARWIALANLALLMGFPARIAPTLFGLQRTYAVAETLRALASALAVVAIARAGGEALAAVAVAASAQALVMLGFTAYVGARLWQLDRRRVQPAHPAAGA